MFSCDYEMMKSLREGKLIFIEHLSFYFLVFLIWRKFDMLNINFYLPTKKRFLWKLTLSNTRKITFVNFKKSFTQFYRKITGYGDILMMYINLLCTAISRSSLRRLFFTIVTDSAIMPAWLVKKIKE